VNGDSVCKDIFILDWSCGFIRRSNAQNIEISFVISILVLCLESVYTSVFPLGCYNVEDGLVSFHSDVQISRRFDFSWSKPPYLVWVRFSANLDVELKRLTTFDLDIIHIGSINNWRCISCLASNLLRWFGGLSRSSTINSLNSKFVFTMFCKISTFGLAFISVCVHMFEPLGTILFLSFNNIVGDS